LRSISSVQWASVWSCPVASVCKMFARTPCRELVGARLCRCAEADGLGVGAGRPPSAVLGEVWGAVVRVDGTAEV
jgi:hypothetical protein